MGLADHAVQIGPPLARGQLSGSEASAANACSAACSAPARSPRRPYARRPPSGSARSPAVSEPSAARARCRHRHGVQAAPGRPVGRLDGQAADHADPQPRVARDMGGAQRGDEGALGGGLVAACRSWPSRPARQPARRAVSPRPSGSSRPYGAELQQLAHHREFGLGGVEHQAAAAGLLQPPLAVVADPQVGQLLGRDQRPLAAGHGRRRRGPVPGRQRQFVAAEEVGQPDGWCRPPPRAARSARCRRSRGR